MVKKTFLHTFPESQHVLLNVCVRTYAHLMSPEDSGLRKRLWSLFCTRLSHQLSLAALSDLKSVHKRGSATHHVCLFLAALLPLTACLSFCIHFSCPPFPSQPQCLSISHIFSRSCACPRPVSVEQITARCTPRCPLDSLSFPLAAATPPLPPPIFFFSRFSSVFCATDGGWCT